MIARDLLKKRIEIPVHYDRWMRGQRFGFVTSVGKDGRYVRVLMDGDAPSKPRLKLWRLDFDYAKVLN